MAALPRRFGPDVSDTIMRFAVGYPRDRLRDIANNIERIEHHNYWCSLVEWRPKEWRRWLMVVAPSVGTRDCFRRWEL